MPPFDAHYCSDGEDHDWQADPERRGEGLACTLCGLTEAELAGEDGPDA